MKMHNAFARAQLLYRGKTPHFIIPRRKVVKMNRQQLINYIKKNEIEFDSDLDTKSLSDIAKSIDYAGDDDDTTGDDDNATTDDERDEIIGGAKKRKTQKKLEEIARETIVEDFANKDPVALMSLLKDNTKFSVCASYRPYCSRNHLMRMLFCFLTDLDLGIDWSLVCLELGDENDLETWLQTPILTYATLNAHPESLSNASEFTLTELRDTRFTNWNGYHQHHDVGPTTTNSELLTILLNKWSEYDDIPNFIHALFKDAKDSFPKDYGFSMYVLFLSSYYDITSYHT